jgi:hypothetical protein
VEIAGLGRGRLGSGRRFLKLPGFPSLLPNHHNRYVNESALSVSNAPGTIGAPLPVIALKGGLNSIALGGNHDERRFGQFSLAVDF